MREPPAKTAAMMSNAEPRSPAPSPPSAAARATLREFSARDDRELQAVAALHMELLAFGPMAGLGELFIREVCYRMLMAEGQLRVVLYEVDGEPAGFAAYTDHAFGFHRSALHKRLPRIGWVLMRSFLQEPARVLRFLRALRVLGSRRGEKKQAREPAGEVVCVAVRPQYLRAGFVRETGLRLSEELIRHCARELRVGRMTQMRMLVDADNRAVLLLYHLLGARFTPYVQAGEPMVEVWFDLTVPGKLA
jgi:ribosomal protein S18 acetylase RimI-like enzyme